MPTLRIDYKLNDKFDVGLIFSSILLLCIGLLAIYSSTLHNPHANGNFHKQVIWGIGAIIGFFIIYTLPTNIFKAIAIPSYLFSIFLLIVVLLIGKRVYGAKSWLGLEGIGFQPSEFAKLGTILALSYFLSNSNTDLDSFKDILISLIIGLFPVGLIMIEPDLGTSFVFLGMVLILLYWKGISTFGLFVVLSPGIVAISSLFGPYYLAGSLVAVTICLFLFRKDIFSSGSIFALNIAAGFFAKYVYEILSQHQQTRIKSFINPWADPLGAGYNAIQAKVAVGSGGLFGKGFLSGNQTQLQFIPEQWTDFIFCVIGEEFGFIGTSIVLALFFYLLLRIFKIATTTKDEFLSLTIIGILSVYFIHLLINIGMVVGIMPVIGIPLPFMSYGGSSLVLDFLMLSVVANVHRTRKNYT